MLGDGRYPTEYSGTTTDAGNTAVLEVGSIVLQGTGAELIADIRVREAYLGG